MNNNTNTIIEAGDAKYLGEIPGFTDLPSGCRFNKVLTGSGGTSVALSNDIPYVLCMPYKALINNKMEWCNERNITALPVHGDAFSTEDVSNFDGKKIMATYNSLYKVVEGLGERVSDFKILIDEYHLLINSGSFRYKAVNEVLDLYKLFGDFVFMTATPTKPEYLPKDIKTIPEVTVQWNDVAPVTLDYSVINHKLLYPTVANIAEKYFTGEYEGNAYFFLNSVRGIIDIVTFLNKLDVTHEDVRIVCGDREKNQIILEETLGSQYRISSASDFPCKINFLTSTAFEGADMFDTEGITYIVSNGEKPHTKYDIMTTVPQIIGRIRNTNYKNWAKIIFSPSEYFSHTTEAEFEKSVKMNLAEAQRTVEDFMQGGDKTKKLLLDSAKKDKYLVVTDNKELEVNETAWCAEMQYFNAMHTTYYVKLDQQGKPLQKDGSRTQSINGVPYVFNSIPTENITPNRLDAVRLGIQKKQFKDLVELYYQWHSNVFSIPTASVEKEIKLIEELFPLIPKALKILGYDQIKAMEFNKKKIAIEVIKMQALANPTKVQKLLCSHTYARGKRIPFSKIKEDLNKIYQQLGINRTAKATDLRYVFDVKACKIKREDKRVDGYKIIVEK